MVRYHVILFLLLLPVLLCAQPLPWTPEIIGSTDPPGAKAILDFDQDGDLDIVLSAVFGPTGWYENVEDGTWQYNNIGDFSMTRGYLPIGDFDGDGDYDVAAGIRHQSFHALMNDDFVFHDVLIDDISDYHYAHAGDFDQDGRDEIAIILPDENAGIYLFHLEEGEWIMETLITWPEFDNLDAHGIDVKDWDSDGDLDIIFSLQVAGMPRVHVLLQELNVWSDIPLAISSCAQLEVVDLDEDGLLDIVGYVSGFGWFRQRENGSFERIFLTGLGPSNEFAVGDLDADGDLDLVGVIADGISFAEQQEDHQFVETLLPTEYSTTIGAGDFDSDGDLDLLRVEFSLNDVQIWWRNGQPDPVMVQIDPLFEPPYIAIPGSSIEYDLRVIYRRTAPVNAIIWSDADTPNGNTVGPLQTVHVQFSGFDTLLVENLLQQIPQDAPEGSYQFRVNVGPTIQNSLESDQFEVLIIAP
jgi:FG-GAP-like repeat